jgi:hypothetical protein
MGDMVEREEALTTPDGEMLTFIFHPEHDAPHPVVLYLMDAPSIRPALRDMASRLATAGYYVMLPYLFYRGGPFREFGMSDDDMHQREVGNAARDRIADKYPGRKREVFQTATKGGGRYIDVLTEQGLAIESKVGRTALDSGIRNQIAKDVELLADPNSDVNALLWEFSTSPTTGLSGPTAGVAKLLDASGIPWIVTP